MVRYLRKAALNPLWHSNWKGGRGNPATACALRPSGGVFHLRAYERRQGRFTLHGSVQ
jgi:hypothetical protein